MERTLLDTIFKTSEEDVETFWDVLQKSSDHLAGADKSDAEKIISGKPDKISRDGVYADQISGLIKITNGWHGENYVWHISPIHLKRPWNVSISRAIYAIAQVMNTVIPSSVEVNIYPPFLEWDIQEITFKAMNLRQQWNIRDKDIEQMNAKLFTVLNTLV